MFFHTGRSTRTDYAYLYNTYTKLVSSIYLKNVVAMDNEGILLCGI